MAAAKSSRHSSSNQHAMPMADATFSHKETHNSSSVLAAALYVQTMGCFQALAAGNMQQDVMQYLQAAGIAHVKVSQPAGAPQA